MNSYASNMICPWASFKPALDSISPRVRLYNYALTSVRRSTFFFLMKVSSRGSVALVNTNPLASITRYFIYIYIISNHYTHTDQNGYIKLLFIFIFSIMVMLNVQEWGKYKNNGGNKVGVTGTNEKTGACAKRYDKYIN